jgi:hypothetical protein
MSGVRVSHRPPRSCPISINASLAPPRDGQAGLQYELRIDFSLFDVGFRTYRVPGPCNKPLGVPESMGEGFIGKMVHPLKPSSYRYFLRSIQVPTWQGLMSDKRKIGG